MMTLTSEQLNVVLKSVGQSIISRRKRLDGWRGPPHGRKEVEHELDLLVEARDVLEGHA